MARVLVLLRHAKAAEGAVDIERPLTGRGHRDARAAGSAFAELGVVPDRVVVSPALRTRQTWDGAQAALGAEAEIVIDERIYDNEIASLWEVVHDVPDSVQTLVLVGHNPSISELVHDLDDGDGDARARERKQQGCPTAAVAVFDVPDAPWEQVRPHTATLTSFTVARAS